MKFKVGDEVVIADDSIFTHRVGQAGVVTGINEIFVNYKYKVETNDGADNWMSERDIRKLTKLERAMK